MHPGAIVIILHIVVRLVIDLGLAHLILRVLKVQSDFILRWFDRLRAILTVTFFVVIHEVCQVVGAERAIFGRVGASTIKHDQSWSSLPVVQLDIVILKDFLTASEIHQAKIKSVPVDGRQTRQIPKHVICRLHDARTRHWRQSKHYKPWFSAPVCIDDPIIISLVVKQSDSDFSPPLVDPIVHPDPVLIQIDAQSDLVGHLTVLFDV